MFGGLAFGQYALVGPAAAAGASEVLVVGTDDRTLAIGSDARMLTVGDDGTRAIAVGGEDRVYVVPADTRTKR